MEALDTCPPEADVQQDRSQPPFLTPAQGGANKPRAPIHARRVTATGD